MSERKGRITVRFRGRSRRVRCTLVGEHLAVHPGLHRDGDHIPNAWRVTHVKTSRILCSCWNQALALGAAREMDRFCKRTLRGLGLVVEIRERDSADHCSPPSSSTSQSSAR